jgi:hypothetical protein
MMEKWRCALDGQSTRRRRSARCRQSTRWSLEAECRLMFTFLSQIGDWKVVASKNSESGKRSKHEFNTFARINHVIKQRWLRECLQPKVIDRTVYMYHLGPGRTVFSANSKFGRTV